MRVSVDPAIAELQKLRPAKLRVFVRDSDEAKAVAIPANRKKWERLGAILEGLDWVRIEALDSRGNIVGVVAREEEETPVDTDLGAADLAGDVASIVNIVVKAQQMALQQQAAMIKPLIDGNAKLVETVTAALGAVAGAYRMALAAASTTNPGGGKEGDDGDAALFRFLQVGMAMAQMRSGGGAAGAMAGVKAVADATPRKNRGTAPAEPQPSSSAAPGR